MHAKPDLTLSAPEQRRQDPSFIARCNISALAGLLPLRWPSSPNTPPSPKRHYRSDYQPPDPGAALRLDSAAWAKITPFDLILLLVDFSNMRPVLAALLYKASARGRAPIPYGSPAWNQLYRRSRNGVESRNSKLEGWSLKRLPVFGTPRGQGTIFLADVWINLTTMARLIKEATIVQLAHPGVAA